MHTGDFVDARSAAPSDVDGCGHEHSPYELARIMKHEYAKAYNARLCYQASRETGASGALSAIRAIRARKRAVAAKELETSKGDSLIPCHVLQAASVALNAASSDHPAMRQAGQGPDAGAYNPEEERKKTRDLIKQMEDQFNHKLEKLQDRVNRLEPSLQRVDEAQKSAVSMQKFEDQEAALRDWKMATETGLEKWKADQVSQTQAFISKMQKTQDISSRDLHSTSSKLNELERAVSDVQTRMNKLKLNEKAEMDKLKAIEKDITDLRTNTRTIKNDAVKLKTDGTNSQNALNTLEKSLQEQRATVTRLESELNALKADMPAAGSVPTLLEFKKKLEGKDAVPRLETVGSLAKEMESLSNQCRQLKTLVSKQKQEREEHVEEVNEIRSGIETHLKQIKEEHQRQFGEFESFQQATEARVDQLKQLRERQINQLETDQKEARARIQQLGEKHKLQLKEIDDLQEAIGSRIQQVEEQLKEAARVQGETGSRIRGLQNEHDRQLKELENFQKDNGARVEQLGRKAPNRPVDVSEMEGEGLQQQLDELRKNMETTFDNMAKVNVSVGEIEEKVESLEEVKFKHMEGTVDGIMSDYTRLKDELNGGLQQQNYQRAEIERAHANSGRLETRVDKFDDQMQQFNAALRSLGDRYDNLSTEGLFQMMTNWMGQAYPNAPVLQQRVNALTSEINKLGWIQQYYAPLIELVNMAPDVQTLLKATDGQLSALHQLQTLAGTIDHCQREHKELHDRFAELNTARIRELLGVYNQIFAAIHQDQQMIERLNKRLPGRPLEIQWIVDFNPLLRNDSHRRD